MLDTARRLALAACALLCLAVVSGCASRRSASVQPAGRAAGAVAPPVQPVPGEAALLAAGIRAEREGRTDDARSIFERGIAEEPVVRDHHLYRLARVEKAAGRLEEAGARLTQLAQEYPESVLAGDTLATLAETREIQGRDDEAAALARQFLGTRPGESGRDRARLVLATTEEKAGRTAEAHRILGELRSQSPRSALTPIARARMEALEAASPTLRPGDDPEALFARAAQLSRENSHQDALEILDGLASRFGGLAAPTGGPTARRALWLAASECFALGLGAEGEARLRQIAWVGPGTETAEEASIKLALRLWNREETDEAIRLLAPIASRGGGSAEEALYLLARIREEKREYPAALAFHARLLKLFPNGKRAEEALWRTGWLRFRSGQSASAAQAFAQLASGSSSTSVVNKARYWRAWALEASGQGKAARAALSDLIREDPDGYYGMVARKKLAGEPPSRFDPLPPGALPLPETPQGAREACAWYPPAGPDETARPVDPFVFHRERAAALAASALGDLATAELRAAVEAASGTREAERLLDTARCLAGLGSVGASLKAAQRALDAGFAEGQAPEKSLTERLLYPLPYWGEVRSRSESRGLDPFLVAALMRQESAYDPRALSPAGARGLMQLMPQTLERLAGGDTGPDPEVLYDPATNIDYGTRELAGTLARFRANPALALAAYNAGSDKVEKWLARYPGVPEDEFIESIPFQETRDYVKKVLRNWEIYRRIYTGVARAAT